MFISMIHRPTLSQGLLINCLRSPSQNQFFKHKSKANSSCCAIQNKLRKKEKNHLLLANPDVTLRDSRCTARSTPFSRTMNAVKEKSVVERDRTEVTVRTCGAFWCESRERRSADPESSTSSRLGCQSCCIQRCSQQCSQRWNLARWGVRGVGTRCVVGSRRPEESS